MVAVEKKVVGSYAVRVRGMVVETITVRPTRRWAPDSEDYRYRIQGDEIDDGADDPEEVRSMLADAIRDARNAAIDRRRDADNDALAEAIDAIVDSGRADKALAALRMAGLI